jgi:ABC-type molybdate transport system permease subunit
MTVAAIVIATTTVKGRATAKILRILALIVPPVWLGFAIMDSFVSRCRMATQRSTPLPTPMVTMEPMVTMIRETPF